MTQWLISVILSYFGAQRLVLRLILTQEQAVLSKTCSHNKGVTNFVVLVWGFLSQLKKLPFTQNNHCNAIPETRLKPVCTVRFQFLDTQPRKIFVTFTENGSTFK